MLLLSEMKHSFPCLPLVLFFFTLWKLKDQVQWYPDPMLLLLLCCVVGFFLCWVLRLGLQRALALCHLLGLPPLSAHFLSLHMLLSVPSGHPWTRSFSEGGRAPSHPHRSDGKLRGCVSRARCAMPLSSSQGPFSSDVSALPTKDIGIHSVSFGSLSAECLKFSTLLLSIPLLSILNISVGGFASPSLLKLALFLKVEKLHHLIANQTLSDFRQLQDRCSNNLMPLLHLLIMDT